MIFDVIVVGGGLAGLTAADALVTADPSVRVALLEARPRLGGRTYTVAEGNATFDLGGQWIGPRHSCVLGLVKRFGLKVEEQLYPGTTTTAPAVSDALRLVEAVGYPLPTISDSDQRDIEAFLSFCEAFTEGVDLEAPWGHPLAGVYDAETLSQAVSRMTPSVFARSHICLFAQTVLACSPERVSFFFFLVYLASGGGMKALGDGEDGAQKWKVVGGMQQVSARLAESLEKKNIFLNVAVTSFAWGDPDKVVINDGAFTARRVIFAVSPLLMAPVCFTPPLPSPKQQLHDAYLPGACIKVLVGYPRAFWLTATFPTTPPPPFPTIGPVHNLFHGSTSEYGGVCIIGLITGQPAEHSSMTHDASSRRAIVLRQLRDMYGCEEAFAPDFYIENDWCKESFSGGCFASFLPPGCFSTLGEWLRRPVGGTLFWASTETASEYSGYFEGAVRSGIRAAAECMRE